MSYMGEPTTSFRASFHMCISNGSSVFTIKLKTKVSFTWMPIIYFII